MSTSFKFIPARTNRSMHAQALLFGAIILLVGVIMIYAILVLADTKALQ